MNPSKTHHPQERPIPVALHWTNPSSTSSSTSVLAMLKRSSTTSRRTTSISTTPITSVKRCSTGSPRSAHVKWSSISAGVVPMSIVVNARHRYTTPLASAGHPSSVSCSNTVRTRSCATRTGEHRWTRLANVKTAAIKRFSISFNLLTNGPIPSIPKPVPMRPADRATTIEKSRPPISNAYFRSSVKCIKIR